MPARPLRARDALARLFLLLLVGCQHRTPAATSEQLLAEFLTLTRDAPPGFHLVGVDLHTGTARPPSSSSSIDARVIRARLEQLYATTSSPEALEAVGLADVRTGDVSRGLAVLSERLRVASTSGRAWNALGVGYLLAARTGTELSASYYVRALDAFLKAQRMPGGFSAPRMNLQITLGEMGLASYASLTTSPKPPSASQGHEGAARLTGRAEWDALHPRLHEARLSDADLADIARRFPQATKECAEHDLLRTWAEQAAKADSDAGGMLSFVARLASLSREADPFLSDLVQTLKADSRRRAPVYLSLVRSQGLYEAGQYEQSLAFLTTARRASSMLGGPLAARADLHLATLRYQQRRVSEAQMLCDRVIRAAGRYPALTARAHWLRGITRMQSARIEAALEDYDAAIAFYERLEETENVAAVASAAADSLRILGEYARGWSYLVNQTFRAFDSSRSVRRRYVALLNASLYASAEHLPDAALLFQDASVHEAYERGVANTIVEGLSRRAVLRFRAGETAAADRDLQEATARLPAITSEVSRRYQGAWLGAVRAEILVRRAPAEVTAELDALLPVFQAIEAAELPHLLTIRGDAERERGENAAAERSYQAAIDTLVRRWSLLSADRHRLAYWQQGWPAYERAIGLALDRADGARAFALAEDSRARSLSAFTRAGATQIDLAAVRRMLDPSTQLVYFLVLDTRLVSWNITHTEQRLTTRPIDEASLRRRVAAFRTLLQEESSTELRLSMAKGLFDELLGPYVDGLDRHKRIAIVADGPLHELPFAALFDARTGRYLIETHELAVAPSAKEFIASSLRLERETTRRAMGVLAAGDFAAGSGRPALPAVRVELRNIAEIYPRATRLEGVEATASRVAQLAPEFDVVHIAGHAQVSLTDPAQSYIQLAPTAASDGRTYARTIAGWSLPSTRLVVLAACDTANGGVYRGEGIMGLTRAFLAARVPSVIGTLWQVDDRTASLLASSFHRAYVETGDAWGALAAAQRRALEMGPRGAQHWAAFVLTSGLPPRRAPAS